MALYAEMAGSVQHSCGRTNIYRSDHCRRIRLRTKRSGIISRRGPEHLRARVSRAVLGHHLVRLHVTARFRRRTGDRNIRRVGIQLDSLPAVRNDELRG
jgi:hypothetical protein